MNQLVSVSFVLFLVPLYQGCLGRKIEHSNDVEPNPRSSKSDDLLWDMLDNCVNSEVKSVTTCLKLQVLQSFDYDVSRMASARSLSDNQTEKIDRMVVKRFHQYLKSRQFKLHLPEFFFQGATLIFDAKKGLTDFDVQFPAAPETEDRSISAARDMMQQKALLPLLMLLKMKLKMITPIMLTLVSIKATKALLMSKLALFLVSAFMISQVVKKLGMNLPMLHPPVDAMPLSMTTSAYGPPPPPPPPPSSYGAPAPSSSYGAPSPSSSYGSPSQSSNYAEPNNAWEPSSSSSNNYAKMWDAQQLAYSAYYKPSGSSSYTSSTSSS